MERDLLEDDHAEFLLEFLLGKADAEAVVCTYLSDIM
jgi:hypothetical protein